MKRQTGFAIFVALIYLAGIYTVVAFLDVTACMATKGEVCIPQILPE